MNEIEKLYKKAGIKNYRLHSFVGFVPNGYKAVCYEDNPNKVKEVVRDFTAEKQIELIKWLAVKYKNIGIRHTDYIKGGWQIFEANYGCYSKDDGLTEFKKVLASLFNNLWQDLTEEERKQIKEILE